MITVVTGLTRCGSTMVMRMLHEGGMPVYVDNTVSMETDKNLWLPKESSWLADCDDKAVKLSEPLQFTPSRDHDYCFILLLRDYTEQAKSQIKVMNLLQKPSIPCSAIPKLAASIRRDIPKMRALLQELGKVHEVRFEDILRQPLMCAARLALFLKQYRILKEKPMAAVVLPRPSHCLPGLLELEQLEGHTRSGEVR